MNFKILSSYLLLSLALSGSVCQASNFSLKSKTIIGLFAAAGSALATGTAAAVESFKKGNQLSAADQISDLQWQVNHWREKEVNRWNYNEGMFIGALLACCAAMAVTAIAIDLSAANNAKKNGTPQSNTNIALGADIMRTDKELIAKA